MGRADLSPYICVGEEIIIMGEGFSSQWLTAAVL